MDKKRISLRDGKVSWKGAIIFLGIMIFLSSCQISSALNNVANTMSEQKMSNENNWERTNMLIEEWIENSSVHNQQSIP
ncbi:hypothetical protein [Ectobacillus antri]|uniref:hypothetical protein n=1 Tax=Ectobacillus antri TaxID=2486280 RepID=UPI000F5A62A7|nr:hypothetical protein [Ectobacillus antri]